MYNYAPSELATIDKVLEPKLAWAKKGTAEAQQLALDATRLLSCTEERLDDYKSKGFFKRCWSGLSGKTGETSRVNQHDLIEMQRISWRYLSQLQERNLMTAHAIITVKNNLLTLAIAEQETRAEIERMANRIYERFEELEERMRSVEAAANIHGWLLTLDTRDYDEKFSPHFRLLRVLRDFYALKSDDWNIQELRYLQQALKNVELPWKRQISLHSFICEIVDEIEAKGFTAYDGLIAIVNNGDKIQPSFVTANIAVPSYVSLFEIADKYGGSSKVIEVLEEKLNISRKDAITKVLLKFVEDQGIDLEYKLPLRDVAVELLHCLQLTMCLYKKNNANKETLPDSANKTARKFREHDRCRSKKQKAKKSPSFPNDGTTSAEKPQKKDPRIIGLQKAAEQGEANAQHELAKYYEKHDVVQMLKWYRLAAEQNYVEAQFRLGEIYEDGKVVELDNAEAVKWYKKAAEQNYVEAQFHLGMMYAKGKGVVLDYVQAYAWLTLCDQNSTHIENIHRIYDSYSSDGADDAISTSEAILRVRRLMTSKQIDKAERLSKEFLKSLKAGRKPAFLQEGKMAAFLNFIEEITATQNDD